MMNKTVIIIGKLFSKISRVLNLGNGSTWPGHIALKLNPDFIRNALDNSHVKTILIIGTNGKNNHREIIRNYSKRKQKKSIN